MALDCGEHQVENSICGFLSHHPFHSRITCPGWAQIPPSTTVRRKFDISLLLTCRQCYSESINLFYSTIPKYFVAGLFTKVDWIGRIPLFPFLNTVPTQRLRHIQKIHIMLTLTLDSTPHRSYTSKDDYPNLWTRVNTSFPGLREVRIGISVRGAREGNGGEDILPSREEFEERWLAPLRGFRERGFFEVNIHLNGRHYFEQRREGKVCGRVFSERMAME